MQVTEENFGILNFVTKHGPEQQPGRPHSERHSQLLLRVPGGATGLQAVPNLPAR